VRDEASFQIVHEQTYDYGDYILEKAFAGMTPVGHLPNMLLRHIILAKKVISAPGQWQSGKMPRTAFPLSKSKAKAYRLGNRRWRALSFTADGNLFRLLVSYSYDLGQFQAMLGMDDGGDTKLLARLERHPTHAGWHMHVTCDSDDAPPGIKAGPWVRCLHGKLQRKYKRDVPQTDAAAFQMAVSVFRLDRTEGGGLT
jgi:hypothetical protein